MSMANAVRFARAISGAMFRQRKLDVPKPSIRTNGAPPWPYRSTWIDPGPTGMRSRSASMGYVLQKRVKGVAASELGRVRELAQEHAHW
jgi:hypothetical protein